MSNINDTPLQRGTTRSSNAEAPRPHAIHELSIPGPSSFQHSNHMYFRGPTDSLLGKRHLPTLPVNVATPAPPVMMPQGGLPPAMFGRPAERVEYMNPAAGYPFGRPDHKRAHSEMQSMQKQQQQPQFNPTLVGPVASPPIVPMPRHNSANNSQVPPMLGLPVSLDPTVVKLLLNVMQFSFSSALNMNSTWIQLICQSVELIVKFIATKPKDHVTMKNILKAISKELGLKVFKINRKKEELLSLEASIVLAFMKSKYCDNIDMDMSNFLTKYPEFAADDISVEERAKLLEFCNCVRVVQCLIPPHNNKEHILDLVSRLTEGYAVRRVTGTGMTQETRRRYEIIHKEGNLTTKPRSDRFDERSNSDGDAGSSDSSPKKRSKPNPKMNPDEAESLNALKNEDSDKLLLLLEASQTSDM